MQIIDREKLELIGAKKLADSILVIYMGNKNLHREIEMVIARNSNDKQEIISLVKGVLSFLNKSTRNISSSEVDKFSSLLDMICDAILNLSDIAPNDAMELMVQFLNFSTTILARCEDKEVLHSFKEASYALLKIAKRANISIDETVKIVLEIFWINQKDIYNEIIKNFADILGNSGLNLLKSRFQSQLKDEKVIEKEKLAIMKAEEEKLSYFFEFKNSDEMCHQQAMANVLIKIKHGLEEISDCQSNIDEYIMACIFPKTNYEYCDFDDEDKQEIVERLIKGNRPSEALLWIENIKNKKPDDKLSKLIIIVLEANNKPQEAQNKRISWFKKTLNYDVFEEIGKHSSPTFMKFFKKKALETALSHDDVLKATNFLLKNNSHNECSQFIQNNLGKFQTKDYSEIPAIAEQMQKDYPLIATLLYRTSLENALYQGKNFEYIFAAKILVICGKLSDKITDFKEYPNHPQYLSIIRKNYEKKRGSFWKKYDKELKAEKNKEKNKKYA